MTELIDLQVDPEYRDALRGLNDLEMETLRKNIIADGFLDPIKYHFNPQGEPVIVDGMNRHKIWKTLPADCFHVPKIQEVEALNGASSGDIVDWIQRTQTGRRNDDALLRRYTIGKRYNDGDDAVGLAEEFKLSVASVTSYGKFAQKIDSAEYESPGAKKTILASEKPVAAVERAIEEKDIAKLVRDEPAAPRIVNHFKTAKENLARLTRAIERQSSDVHSGKTELSDSATGLCVRLREVLNSWEILEIGATDGKEEKEDSQDAM